MSLYKQLNCHFYSEFKNWLMSLTLIMIKQTSDWPRPVGMIPTGICGLAGVNPCRISMSFRFCVAVRSPDTTLEAVPSPPIATMLQQK